MIGPVETALKAKLAQVVTDWPIRWPNEDWVAGTMLTTGGLPANADGTPAAFILAEVIAGTSDANIAPAGHRHSTREGLFRCYLSVPQGTGRDDVNAKSDAIDAALKRKTIFYDGSVGQRLITMDPRIDDGVAGYESGNYFVRMISTPFIFDFFS